MRRIWFVVSLLIGLSLVLPVGAQILPGQSSGATKSQAETPSVPGALADVLKQATKAGATVIVVDPSGNPVTPAGTTAPAAENSILPPNMSPMMTFQHSVMNFRHTLRDRLSAMPDSLHAVATTLRSASPDGRIATFGWALVLLLACFSVGYLVERQIYGKRIARHFIVPLIKPDPQGYTEKFPFLVIRFLGGVIGIGVSLLVAYGVGLWLFGWPDNAPMQFTLTVIFAAYGVSRLVVLIWRMVLAPFISQYRIPHFSNHDALKLYYWLSTLAMMDIWSVAFTTWIKELGLNYDVYALMGTLSSLVLSSLNIAMVFSNGRAISRAMCKSLSRNEGLDGASLGASFVSRIWGPAVILYVVFTWLKLTYDLVLERPTPVPLLAGAYAIVISMVIVYAVINFMIERGFERARAIREMNRDLEMAPDGTEIEPRPVARPVRSMQSFEDLAHRVSGILAMVAGLWAGIEIWGARTSMVSDSLYSQIVSVITIAFMAYIVYHAFRIWIDNKIADEQGDQVEVEIERGDEGGTPSASRLSTLLPLFRVLVLSVIVVTFGMILLLQLGINVTPLFTGAGVVGLAIGFGAQSLIRDIFSGAFFLIDDAFRKGEYVDTGMVKGTVEKISLRSFQLRHHRGPLNTIPFGAIQHLTNYSRDWAIMKLPLRVTYDTDPEKVRKLIKNLGQSLLEDPVVGPLFLQPLKSQGVIEMQDSAMIIRVKFMTRPLDQWVVRKRVLQDIRDLFEREGIKFANRVVTVRLAQDNEVHEYRDLTPDQKLAIAGAAHLGVMDDLEDGELEHVDDMH
ncbi:mechanosensitive ion channel [bacterium]|nr:mechanosensitive ion channel [bacterium]